jgi:tetratricopeptide (TPR) repeat protein
MKLALRSAGTASDAAWASSQLGDLWFSSGRFDRAASMYRMGISLDASFAPPRAGLARVNAARGRIAAAIRGYRRVVRDYPLPEYVSALGDLYGVQGRTGRAEREYALVGVQRRLMRANGVNVDLEIGLFDADHRVDLGAGLAAARAEWRRRKSVQVADAMAWTLYANHRYPEALPFSRRALRLGTRNALFYFHRGMIRRALGNRHGARADIARALSINPRFSILWSGRAEHVLRMLGGAP